MARRRRAYSGSILRGDSLTGPGGPAGLLAAGECIGLESASQSRFRSRSPVSGSVNDIVYAPQGDVGRPGV